MGLGKLFKAYGAWRKVKPVVDVLQKEGTMGKLKSRKLWVTVAVAAIGALMTGIGVEADKAQMLLDWLQGLVWGYLGAQGAVDAAGAVTSAIAAKKNGGGQ